MATSRGLLQFGIRFRVIANLVFGNASARIRRAALAADQAAVFATPVDTGRARANWVVSLGSASSAQGRQSATRTGGRGTDQRQSANAQRAIAAGERVIAQWAPGKGSIFISNGVPYIQELEHGSSAQAAPHEMTSQAIAAARAELRRGGLLRGL